MSPRSELPAHGRNRPIPARAAKVARHRRGRGFTLLEILLALSLVAMVLVSLNSFIFSMGELWGQNSELRLFEQHVRAVTRFLDQQLRAAALPPAGRTGTNAIAPAELRTSSGTEPLLTFEQPEGCRLFVWPDRPLPEVICSLQVRDRDGLLLLWHSRLETRFKDDLPREALVSPLVTGLSYDYYDPTFRNWKNEPRPRRNSQNQYDPPQRLRLKFTYGKMTRESVITLPATPEALPNF